MSAREFILTRSEWWLLVVLIALAFGLAFCSAAPFLSAEGPMTDRR